MQDQEIPFEKQIFVCTNDTPGQNGCCAARGGMELFKELRKIAKERRLHPRIRVAQARCLGKCAAGANVMIFPDNIWFSAVTPEDVTQISDEHLSLAKISDADE